MKRLSFLILLIMSLIDTTTVLAKPLIGDRLVLMWSVPNDITNRDLDFLSRRGVNLVQSWDVDRKWNNKEIRSYLIKMQKHHIGVIMTINKFFKNGYHSSQIKNNAAFSRAAAFIKKWKSYPAVFAWHPFDEAQIPGISAAYQERVYQFIKHLDPTHPVFISWNGSRAAHYDCCFSERSFDILGLYSYPRYLPGRRQQNVIDEFLSHRQRHYPVIIILRVSVVIKQPDLPPNGLQAQYDFFFKKNRLTKDIGFYGWKLNPNKGISQVPDLMRQFRELKF